MRKQFVLIVALLCVALSGYAQMVVKGKTGGVLYEINMMTQTATVLGAENSPTELTIPTAISSFVVTEFAMNPGAVGSTMSMAATISAIADGAFASLTTLTTVTMEATTPPTLNGTFASTFPAGVTIQVSSEAAKTAYETAGWNNVQVAGGGAVVGPMGNCGAEGDNLQWSYANGTLTISGSGAMADYMFDDMSYSPKTPWKQYLMSITAIELPDGLTYIGTYAFYGCLQVKEVVIPEGVTAIGNYAFTNCQTVKSYTFPSTLQNVGNGMFSNNYAIREIIANGTVPPDMHENKLNQGASFTIDVYVPEGSIEAYEQAWGTTYYTFHNPKNACGTNLLWSYDADTHALSLYKSDPSKPATMTNFVNISDQPQFFNTPDAPWYQYHDEMASISLPDGLTNIGSMAFVNCSTVVSEVVIPASVVTIEELAFGYCHAIPSIDIPEGVQSIGTKAFVGCSALDTIAIPAGISTIKESTFEWCSGLTHIVIPASVQTIELSAFTNCANLVRIDVESEIPASIAKDINVSGFMGAISNGQRVFGRDYSDGGDVDIEVYIPSGTRAAYETAWGTETAVDVLGTHQVQCRLNYHDPADISTGVEEANGEWANGEWRKVLRNGQILIQRGEEIYSLDGKRQ